MPSSWFNCPLTAAPTFRHAWHSGMFVMVRIATYDEQMVGQRMVCMTTGHSRAPVSSTGAGRIRHCQSASRLSTSCKASASENCYKQVPFADQRKSSTSRCLCPARAPAEQWSTPPAAHQPPTCAAGWWRCACARWGCSSTQPAAPPLPWRRGACRPPAQWEVWGAAGGQRERRPQDPRIEAWT